MKHVAPLCPSARAETPNSVVLGVIREVDGEPFLHHLAEPAPVTPDILRLASGVSVYDVFRFAAPCAENACQHFDGSHCRLAQKIADVMAPASALPPCRIRPDCRWFLQEGKRACHRCPLILSESANPTKELVYAADPLT
jgi:hypothetical protein